MPSFIDLDGLRTFKENLNLSGGGGLLPIVKVTSESGNTVTMSKDDTTLTATESSGTWEFNVPSYGDWIITATDGQRSNSKTISIDTVKIYNTSVYLAKRYGYRISKTEADPDARVEYLYDAEGFTPAHMDFVNETFDYGDWQDVWFVKDNKPLMLKYNGTVDYYLDPNDYSKKEDGSASDVANTSYGGNAMAQFPLCWVYRYEDDDYYYEIVSDIQWDENYKAYAHTDKNGNIKDYFYFSIFASSLSDSKARSISGKDTVMNSTGDWINQNMSFTQAFTYAANNGSNWYPASWSHLQLIRTLSVLISKSTDSQSAFGLGFTYFEVTQYQPGYYKPYTGLLNSKGQFFGYNTKATQVKIFHVEQLWGSHYSLVAGAFVQNGTAYIKMSPPYNSSSTSGYSIAHTYSAGFDGYSSQMTVSDFGMLPIAVNGSSSTYFCDRGAAAVSDNLAAFQCGQCPADKETQIGMGGMFTCLLTGISVSTQSSPNYSIRLSYI